MALIKCPECGRANISDSTENCPFCGYNIKEHIKRQKQKEQDDWINERIQLMAAEKFKEYETEMNRELMKIDDMSCPRKPNFLRYMFRKEDRTISCLVLIGPLLALWFYYFRGFYSVFLNFVLLAYAVLGLLAGLGWLYIGNLDYQSVLKKYKEELSAYNAGEVEWKQYKEQRRSQIEGGYRLRAEWAARNMYIRPTPTSTNVLKCPVCGSDNIEKITTVDRGVSIAMVGLASGKIGKQYKCKKCKHMW